MPGKSEELFPESIRNIAIYNHTAYKEPEFSLIFY